MSTHSFTKIVTKCLVTQADTAHDSKATTIPLTWSYIGLNVNAYQPSAIACTHIGPRVPLQVIFYVMLVAAT